MTVIIVALLNGKSKDQWYDMVVERVANKDGPVAPKKFGINPPLPQAFYFGGGSQANPGFQLTSMAPESTSICVGTAKTKEAATKTRMQTPPSAPLTTPATRLQAQLMTKKAGQTGKTAKTYGNGSSARPPVELYTSATGQNYSQIEGASSMMMTRTKMKIRATGNNMMGGRRASRRVMRKRMKTLGIQEVEK